MSKNKQHSKKILIIEDEEVLLDVLEKKLIKDGFTVATAKNGKEGIKKITSFAPDLILLDIIMPEMNGYEVLTWMAKQKMSKKIPTIIISNSGQPVEIERALKLGATDYLIKTQFAPTDVIKKVKHAFGDQERKQTPHKTTAHTASTTQLRSKKSRKGKSVAIIEDDQFLRELIERKLTREGFTTMSALDGNEGYKLIVNKKPDAVLLDIILPSKNGFEVLASVRKHSDSGIANIPIILLSNLGQDSDISKGKKLGATDYLVKASFTTDQIIEKIKTYL